MTDIITILSAAGANATGAAFDAGDLKDGAALEVTTAGTVSAFSVQLQGSMDGTHWVSIGSPLTTATTSGELTGFLARWFRAVLSGFSGTGTVTARIGVETGAGFPSLTQLDTRYVQQSSDPYAWTLPSGAIAQTLPRHLGFAAFAPITGTLSMSGIMLPAGVTIGHLTVTSFGTGAAVSPTNWWLGLWDSSLNQLALTADQLTAAFAVNASKSLAIATTAAGAATSFTTTYSGLHYIGFMMAAGTVVSLCRITGAAAAPQGTAPIIGGNSTVSLTSPPAFPSTATALSVSSSFYAYVSP